MNKNTIYLPLCFPVCLNFLSKSLKKGSISVYFSANCMDRTLPRYCDPKWFIVVYYLRTRSSAFTSQIKKNGAQLTTDINKLLERAIRSGTQKINGLCNPFTLEECIVYVYLIVCLVHSCIHPKVKMCSKKL